jgi:hypothetical protein
LPGKCLTHAIRIPSDAPNYLRSYRTGPSLLSHLQVSSIVLIPGSVKIIMLFFQALVVTSAQRCCRAIHGAQLLRIKIFVSRQGEGNTSLGCPTSHLRIGCRDCVTFLRSCALPELRPCLLLVCLSPLCLCCCVLCYCCRAILVGASVADAAVPAGFGAAGPVHMCTRPAGAQATAVACHPRPVLPGFAPPFPPSLLGTDA